MKRRKQIMIWMLAAILLAGMVSGCGKKKTEEESTSAAGTEKPAETAGPVTAKSLVEQVRDTLDGADSVKGKLSMNMIMDYKAQGVEATLECTMEQDVEQVKETEAIHMAGTVAINLAGILIDTETYTVKENGEYVTYTGSGGQWMKQKTQSTGGRGNAAETMELLLKDPDSLTLEEIDSGEGKNLYQVTGMVTGGNLSGIMSSAGNLLEEDLDIYDQLEAKVTLVADASSGLPVEISMDFTDSYNVVMQANKEAQGFDEVEITAFSITLSGYEMNTVGEITVPDDVKKNAVDLDTMETAPEETEEETKDPEEPESRDEEIYQNESGEYVLETDWDENTVGISCPEGFSYDKNSDKTWLNFNSRENDEIHHVSLVYNLYTIDDNYGEADLAQTQESSYAYMLTSGDYAEVTFDPVQTTTGGGRTVSYTKLSYIYLGTVYTEEYNAWTVMPDGRMIQCTVTEESREEPCSRINPEHIFDTAFAAVGE